MTTYRASTTDSNRTLLVEDEGCRFFIFPFEYEEGEKTGRFVTPCNKRLTKHQLMGKLESDPGWWKKHAHLNSNRVLIKPDYWPATANA